jgi:hypothetical protein
MRCVEPCTGKSQPRRPVRRSLTQRSRREFSSSQIFTPTQVLSQNLEYEGADCIETVNPL